VWLIFGSEIFPGDVDIVIIGSGLTGALIAYHLLSRPGPQLSILMLEARTAASGATGRNGLWGLLPNWSNAE
jgi:glycine/D-amino acid oxidase-like deaminating enzyme